MPVSDRHELTSSLTPVGAPYGVPGSRVQVAHTYCTPHARFGCFGRLSALAQVSVRPWPQTAPYDEATISDVPAAVNAAVRRDRQLASLVGRTWPSPHGSPGACWALAATSPRRLRVVHGRAAAQRGPMGRCAASRAAVDPQPRDRRRA